MEKRSYKKSILNLQAKTVITLVLLISAAPVLPKQTKTVALKKGQLISLITSISKTSPEAKQAKGQYFQKVFPVAASSGFKQEGSFAISEFRAGDYKPYPEMSFFSWPSRQAHEKFEDHPDWPEMKKLRTAIWDELRICQVRVNADMDLDFKENKIYNVSFLWLNKEHPGDFEKYSEGMKKTAKKLGVKKILQLPGDYYHSFLQPAVSQPDIVFITEWPSAEARKQYSQSEAFKKNIHYFKSGVTKFDSFVTTFNFPEATK